MLFKMYVAKEKTEAALPSFIKSVPITQMEEQR